MLKEIYLFFSFFSFWALHNPFKQDLFDHMRPDASMHVA